MFSSWQGWKRTLSALSIYASDSPHLFLPCFIGSVSRTAIVSYLNIEFVIPLSDRSGNLLCCLERPSLAKSFRSRCFEFEQVMQAVLHRLFFALFPVEDEFDPWEGGAAG
jgi:hypothetical protein